MEKDFVLHAFRQGCQPRRSVVDFVRAFVKKLASKETRDIIDKLKLGRNGWHSPTLANLEPAISEYSAQHPIDLGLARDIEGKMKQPFAQHDFGVNIKYHNLFKTLKTGLKNQFEVATSEGYVKMDAIHKMESDYLRQVVSRRSFGLGDTSTHLKCVWRDYEKYGSLVDHDVLRELEESNSGMYGKACIRLYKPLVQEFTTWTGGGLAQHFCVCWSPCLWSEIIRPAAQVRP